VAEKMRPKAATPVRATTHADTRSNIPTAELESFARPEERRPTIVRYPRDPSLDPQLVWKGKDEQDASDLEVPAVPIYIQETIDPLGLVEELRAASEGRRSEQQLGFFAPYTNLTFEEKVDFYHHPGKWSNRMILGDSLLVMTSLAEKEGLKGQVQTIYIDPPYGIKFGGNWQISTRNRTVGDSTQDLTPQPEQIRAFRDTWELGIHSYLAYLRDRFSVSRELLTESGSIFVQIGDANVHVVRSVLDEVFGSNCAVVTILVKKKGAQRSSLIDPVNDYLLWYTRSPRAATDSRVKFRPLFEPWGLDSETVATFDQVELADGREFPVSAVPDQANADVDYRSYPERLLVDHPGARLFRANPLTSGGIRTNQSLPFTYRGKTYDPGRGNSWKHTARPTRGSAYSGMDRLAIAGRIIAGRGQLRFKSYLDDVGLKPIGNWWDGLGGAKDQKYVVQTNPTIVERCLVMTTDPGDLVLDPTCGSGTTAYVAEHWGRRWITIDTSRVALALARSRLMAARFPYYLLADSEPGIRKEAELSGQVPPSPLPPIAGDIRRGFVYRRVNHITSTTVANADIAEGMSREEIDAAIARHAETETLFDRPYEDRKVVRVSGPFTVESLSPHRVLVTGPEDAEAAESTPSVDAGAFVTSILDNLRRAGVQNTKREERLTFSRLDPYPGVFVQGVGEYIESGQARTVAIAIGPEFGTVGPELIRDAAKEAVKFADLLVVCGFAFDPLAGEEASTLGRLTILQARMNPDLAMGDELLKKTGTGNLFMVFGEPDIEVRPAGDGQITVEVRGLDVYDPTTGVLRSSSVDDIAAWFLDTNYDGDAFFVRHAYFTGADDPYDKLRRALRADISDEAWATVNSNVSRPFPRPSTGKVALKVINHYGDEVMKVFGV
jgi:adenine-specific DNA-methyltransferase